MRIAVCDDEENVRELLGSKIRSLYPEAEVLLCESGEELLETEGLTDLVLLDIKMPGTDGMETALRLRKEKEEIVLIFVTALEEYVFQAFDVGAFHYLVKPVSDEKFGQVLGKAVEQWEKRALGRQGKTEEKMPQGGLEPKGLEQECPGHGIMIKAGGTCTRILARDILYAEVFNRKVLIHCVDREVESYGKLSDLEERLGQDFFRSHRAYLVHLKYVVKYNASSIALEKGTALMAKKKYPDFVKAYMEYCKRKGMCL